jgi:urease accessory protein
MLTLRERLDRGDASAAITLTFDQRRRSRLRARLDDGREVALMLPRALVLRDGDLLGGDLIARVVAADERVSTARTPDPTLLARAAYHLGNRHVAVEIGAGFARYQHDHVLDDMVRSLGLAVEIESVAFEPEAGAYGGHGHSHNHNHPMVMVVPDLDLSSSAVARPRAEEILSDTDSGGSRCSPQTPHREPNQSVEGPE